LRLLRRHHLPDILKARGHAIHRVLHSAIAIPHAKLDRTRDAPERAAFPCRDHARVAGRAEDSLPEPTPHAGAARAESVPDPNPLEVRQRHRAMLAIAIAHGPASQRQPGRERDRDVLPECHEADR